MRPGGSLEVLENPPARDWFFDSDFFKFNLGFLPKELVGYTKEQLFQSLLLLIDSMDVPKSQPSRTSSQLTSKGWLIMGSL